MDEGPENSAALEQDVEARNRQGLFTATHWSVVLAATQLDAAATRVAIERLCRTYWQPIYAFLRSRGHTPHQAEDLTQSFFVYLLEKESLKRADRQKGKFRTFLLAALTNFLANEWDKRRALKRGGGCQLIAWDEALAEGGCWPEPKETLTPEKVFERRWAATLLTQVLARLKLEYAARGKAELFARLEPGLTEELPPGGFAAIGREFGFGAGAVKVALHRLRRRFGELLRSEIAHTVSSPEEVDEEIRCLFAAIAH